MPNDQPTLKPVASLERVEALDIIRAVALFGVLQMNLIWFGGEVNFGRAGTPLDPGWGGSLLIHVRDAVMSGKAMSMCTMLFGMGLGSMARFAEASWISRSRSGLGLTPISQAKAPSNPSKGRGVPSNDCRH